MLARALLPILGLAFWTSLVFWLGVIAGRERGRAALRQRLLETRAGDIPKSTVDQWSKEL